MTKGETKTIANIRVGKPDVEPSAPSHVRGVWQGNQPDRAQRHKGIEEDVDVAREGAHPRRGTAVAGARRSTGIRPADHDAIDPRMPKLSPS
jgi:hypothetical protein